MKPLDKKERERRLFFAIVHDELSWARKLVNRLTPLYGTGWFDAPPPERIPSEEELKPPHEPKVVEDPNGHIMNCIICGEEETVDGRYCEDHWEGETDLAGW